MSSYDELLEENKELKSEIHKLKNEIDEWKHGICNKSEVKCGDCDFRKFKSLEDTDIVDHLSGQKTIGLYPLLPNDKCKFLAIDFDDSSWQKDALLVVDTFNKFNIPTSIERSRSGNGCHLWIFLILIAVLLGFNIL